MRRLIAGSVSDHRADDGTTKCPEFLCSMRAVTPIRETHLPSPRRTLLPLSRSYGLIRQSQQALLYFGFSLVRKVLANCHPIPAAHQTFPTLSPRIFP